MGPNRVVFLPPSFNQYLRLRQRVEDLAVEQLVSQLAIKRFDVAVLPRAARLDIQRLYAKFVQPGSNGRGRKLRAVIAADVLWNTSRHEQPRQPFQYILRVQASCRINRQALTRVFIQNREHPNHPAVMRPSLNEVIRPHMILMGSAMPHARTVIEPDPPAFGLLAGHLQSGLTPKPLYAFVIHLPAFPS